MHDVFLVQDKHFSDNLIIQKTQFSSIQVCHKNVLKYIIKSALNLMYQKMNN